MNLELQFHQYPSISSEDINFSHPTIPILENRQNAAQLTRAYLQACMLYPLKTQEQERKKVAMVLYSFFLTERPQTDKVVIDKSILRTLIDGHSFDLNILIKTGNKRIQRGHIAGIILLYLYKLSKSNELGCIDEESSVNKAIFFAETTIKLEQKYKRKNKKKLPQSFDQLQRHWYEYKTASHLWLSAYLLQNRLQEEGDTRFVGNLPYYVLSDTTLYSRLFKISEYFRKFGENLLYANKGCSSQSTLFAENEAWRPSANLDLTEGLILFENNFFDDIPALITAWNNREK